MNVTRASGAAWVASSLFYMGRFVQYKGENDTQSDRTASVVSVVAGTIFMMCLQTEDIRESVNNRYLVQKSGFKYD